MYKFLNEYSICHYSQEKEQQSVQNWTNVVKIDFFKFRQRQNRTEHAYIVLLKVKIDLLLHQSADFNRKLKGTNLHIDGKKTDFLLELK